MGMLDGHPDAPTSNASEADKNVAAIMEGGLPGDPGRAEPEGPDTASEPEPQQASPPEQPPEPAAEPQQAATPTEPTPESKVDPLDEKRSTVRQRFDVPEGADSLVDAHAHLQVDHGRQAGEIGDLRSDKARLEGRLEQAEKGTPATPGTPAAATDPDEAARNARWNAGVAHLAAAYEKDGHTPEEARATAEAVLTANSHVMQPEIDAAAASGNADRQANQRVTALFEQAVSLRDEVDAEGNKMRPDWDAIVNSPEFLEIVDVNDVASVDALYTVDSAGSLTPAGIEAAYLRARFKAGDSVRAAATEAAVEGAKTDAEAKIRAAAVPSAAGNAVGVGNENVEADIFATAKGGANAHPLLTGKF